jgi:hypothetical protein
MEIIRLITTSLGIVCLFGFMAVLVISGTGSYGGI